MTTEKTHRVGLDAARAAATSADVAWQACEHEADALCEHRLATDAAGAAVESALVALRDSGEDLEYTIRCGDSGITETIRESSVEDAIEAARDWAREGDWDTSGGTVHVHVYLSCETDEDYVSGRGSSEEERVSVAIEQDEPECSSGDHDWQSPHELVGGIAENPGVWGHGGGVVITECCLRCGCGRKTDTWAQNRTTGEQGLREVTYEPGKYAGEIGALEAAS